MSVKLTAFSKGSGCGCKLSPKILSEILIGQTPTYFENLIVGNNTRDDAAVYQIDSTHAIVSTTDFFTPIVDDPLQFGEVAATNAVSDVYAMGAAPLMAIAILGWPVDKISSEVASDVVNGGREVCLRLGIPLAGGHSIQTSEPIFGLAVTGKVKLKHLKKNKSALPGDIIYLTKPLGTGLVTTAQKKGCAKESHLDSVFRCMVKPNELGEVISKYPFVHAMTDVTGFGLAGHLLEICNASNTGAEISYDAIPKFSFIEDYLEMGTIPGGTDRNWKSYGSNITLLSDRIDYRLIADPQTSGGLLITVDSFAKKEFENIVSEVDNEVVEIGRISDLNKKLNIS